MLNVHTGLKISTGHDVSYILKWKSTLYPVSTSLPIPESFAIYFSASMFIALLSFIYISYIFLLST